jgi:hypothetical protein
MVVSQVDHCSLYTVSQNIIPENYCTYFSTLNNDITWCGVPTYFTKTNKFYVWLSPFNCFVYKDIIALKVMSLHLIILSFFD